MSKEKACLITTTIIGAMNWYLTAPDSIIKEEKGGDGKTTWKDKALEDLKKKLGREKTDFPEAARRGVEFEKMIYTNANKEHPFGPFGSIYFQEVCKKVKGYQFYKKSGINIEIDGHPCYLFAKYDSIDDINNPDSIIDIKTTQEYKKGKYLKGFQHLLYCYITGANKFMYLIAEWEEYPKIKDIHNEDFIVKDRESLEREVHKTISEFLSTLKDLGLWDLYKEKYCLY